MADKTPGQRSNPNGASTATRYADPSDAPDRGASGNHRQAIRPAKDAPDVTTKTPVYRRPWFLIVAAVLLISGLTLGVYYYLHARSHESTDDAFIESSVVQISPQAEGTVQKVYVSDNQWVKAGDLIAELDARDYETRANQARAALAAVEARRDQASANVDLTRKVSYANVEQAVAGVRTARAQEAATARGAQARRSGVDQAAAGTRTAQATLEQTRAEEQAAAAQAELDERDVKRYETLYANDAVSRQRLDQAVAAAKAATAQFDAAHKRTLATAAQVAQAEAVRTQASHEFGQAVAQTDAARGQVGEARGRLSEASAAPERVRVSKREADSADAEIAQAREAVAQADLNLSYTKIYAPESGRITRKSIDEGQLVRIGQPLMGIVYGDMWVTANFKETQLAKMRVGQPVEIKVDTYSGKTFRGHVESFQYGTGARFSALPAQNATGNYVKVVQRIPVKILFDEQPDTHLLAPGMSVIPEVDISAAPNPNAIRRGYGTGGGATEGAGESSGGGGGSGSGSGTTAGGAGETSGAGGNSPAGTGGNSGQSGSNGVQGTGTRDGGGQGQGTGQGSGTGAGAGGSGPGASGGKSGSGGSGGTGGNSGTGGGR